MKDSENKLTEYIDELEEKIVGLSLQLKAKNNELDTVYQSNRQVIRKLVHNLKNPIGVALSFSEMMLSDLELYTSEKLTKHLQIIKSSADFSIQLLTNIANYTRLQSQEVHFIFSKKEYLSIVSSVLDEFSEEALNKNIKIKKTFPDKEIFLILDENEIREALKNVINNALRYSNSNTAVEVIITENSESVETTIIDEGIGISENDLLHVLKEFYVVNTYSEDRQKCIGLGLAIANRIIQLHQGKVSVESKPSTGTTLKIILSKESP